MTRQEDVQKIIQEIVKEIGEEKGNKSLIRSNPNTLLYGKNGHLDSLSLVFLTAGLEQEIYDRLDKEITIADERALSQKSSPFRSIASLSDYVSQLIESGDE
jgi:acyl carrier protein